MLPPVLRILLLATTASWWWLAGRRGCQPSPRPAVQYFTATLETRRFPPVIYNIHTRHYTHWLHTHRAAHCRHLHFYRTLSGEWSAQHHRRLSHTLCSPSSGRQMGDTGRWSCCWLGPDVSNAVIWCAVFAISCIICLDIINM